MERTGRNSYPPYVKSGLCLQEPQDGLITFCKGLAYRISWKCNRRFSHTRSQTNGHGLRTRRPFYLLTNANINTLSPGAILWITNWDALIVSYLSVVHWSNWYSLLLFFVVLPRLSGNTCRLCYRFISQPRHESIRNFLCFPDVFISRIQRNRRQCHKTDTRRKTKTGTQWRITNKYNYRSSSVLIQDIPLCLL